MRKMRCTKKAHACIADLHERSCALGWEHVPSVIENEKSEQRKELESWLNKLMRVKISDGRTLIGSFLCTDKDRNIILGSCQEFVGTPGVDKEDPRILGLAMVPGRHIQSIEVDMHRPPKYGEFA
ncbi:N-alpha-acetyltransferase 38, NatC auxiliary subunit-like isoform X2 [Nematostella vectensis]|uniref:N-alpha-acetyltransferase 38, NatC auxiliary subunit-like isoform X2 n=1 Tax=Nematostella vectensis TaxID=45351 RepID=UPI0013902A35|nr:N-alpha-acetyltransferase 38, NatC auxiliary subunit-like isoform X2 [Nematostella vectensis]